MLLVLRMVRLLADLVAVVGLAAARAHLQPHVDLVTMSTRLKLALLGLIEWSLSDVNLTQGIQIFLIPLLDGLFLLPFWGLASLLLLVDL